MAKGLDEATMVRIAKERHPKCNKCGHAVSMLDGNCTEADCVCEALDQPCNLEF